MEIYPVDRAWIHTLIVEPYLQGCELLNQAWRGIDRSLERNPLCLTDRAICWIQGIALMIPMVNTIIWLAWQTFGKPEKFADPFCPELDQPQVFPPPQIIVHRHADVAGNQIEQFGYIETVNNHSIQTAWMVETFPNMIVTTQNSREFSSSAIYHADRSLKELHYQSGIKRIDFALTEGSQVLVEISNGPDVTTQKIVQIPQDGLPWIQQRAIGLKSFVLSDAGEMEFYSILPEYPSLVGWALSYLVLEATPFVMKVRARKIGQEEVPRFGQLLKVEITSTRGWPYNTVRSELWFDPASGSLKKFVDSGTFITRKDGVFAQNDQ